MALFENTPYGNTGFTEEAALGAGIDLAVDAFKLRPRNVAQLDEDQMRVVQDALYTAEQAGGNSGKDVLRALGATQLRSL